MLKMLLLLPFADFKTISVGGSSVPVAAADGNQHILLAALAVLGVVAILVVIRVNFPRPSRRAKPRHQPDNRRSRRPASPEKRRANLNWIVVDGSNVMHWQDNTARLAPVLKVVNDLRARGFDPGVVFDANAGWKLFGRYLNENEFGPMLGLPTDQVLVVPKGTPADPYILATARRLNTRIVTNDRYRDWADDHPEVVKPGFLIRGELQGDAVRLKDMDAAEALVS